MGPKAVLDASGIQITYIIYGRSRAVPEIRPTPRGAAPPKPDHLYII